MTHETANPEESRRMALKSIERVRLGTATETDAESLLDAINTLLFCLHEETNGFAEWDSMEARQKWREWCEREEWEDMK